MVVVCDLWLADFDPFCLFLRFKVCFFWTSEFAWSYVLTLKFFFLSSYWNTESLDFQGEIVPVELPNPEETQIWEDENESARSRQHLI